MSPHWLEKVCIVVRNELGRYPKQNVHWGIVLPEAFKITGGSRLNVSQGIASPDLVHEPSSSISAPGASPITLLVEFELLGAIPDTEGLDGSELIALSAGEPPGGKVEGDLVKGPKSLHSSPVAGQELCMGRCCYDAVVCFNLLVRAVEHVKRDSGPCIDGKAGGNGCFELG